MWQYLGYENCKCRKELISTLVEEFSADNNGNEIIYNATLNDNRRAGNSSR